MSLAFPVGTHGFTATLRFEWAASPSRTYGETSAQLER